MLPITGPYTKHLVHTPAYWPFNDTSKPNTIYWDFELTRVWYRQKGPKFNLPLTYSFKREEVVESTPYPQWEACNTTPRLPWARALDLSQMQYWADSALSKARDRYNAKIGSTAEWLVSLVEARKSMDMLTTRLQQIYRIFKSLKNRDYGALLKELRWSSRTSYETRRQFITKLRAKDRYYLRRFKRSRDPRYSKVQMFADSVLEVKFGWAPIYRDIVESITLLQAEIPSEYVTSGANIPMINFRVASGDVYAIHNGVAKCKIGATVSVSNPNLFLANNLGLLNPLSASLELVKFSFIADWFFNLSQFCRQFTEFAGIGLANLWYSVGTSDFCVSHVGGGFIHATGKNTCTQVSRSLGALPGVALQVRQPWRLSPGRAITAAALVTQLLPRGRVFDR